MINNNNNSMRRSQNSIYHTYIDLKLKSKINRYNGRYGFIKDTSMDVTIQLFRCYFN